MQIGIRLHDVNMGLSAQQQTFESRCRMAREEGFTCVHLAFQKVMEGITFDDSALTEGLATYTRRLLADNRLDIAVLGCYLNLAHPDPEELSEIKRRYFGHIRVAALAGAGVVGTETGAPNAEYSFDACTHSDAALKTFMYNLEDVLDCAEAYGVTLAIEPVWKHIVYDVDHALRLLKDMGSRNLRIIFDPVNLLCRENVDRRDYIFDEAMDRLGDSIAVVHLKDFVRGDEDLISVAAGTGEMDYTAILRWMKRRKPFIQATLEDTCNESAVTSREYLQKIYRELT